MNSCYDVPLHILYSSPLSSLLNTNIMSKACTVVFSFYILFNMYHKDSFKSIAVQ